MHGSRLSLLCVLTGISTASGSAVDTRPSAEQAGSAGYFRPDADPALANVRPLPFFYDLYTFRGRGRSTTIVSAYAVEAGRLETEPADSRVRYRFSVTLVLADTALRSVSNTHDTVFVDVPRPLDDDHLLYTHVEVLAPPSGDTRQRVIMTDATTPGIGQLYSEYFPIPDYGGSQLMLSDIALGQSGAKTGWTRGDVTLALLPTSQFPTSAFDVYYEVYNLPAGHEYTTEIAVDYVERSGAAPSVARDPVRLRFSGVSAARADDTLPELRRVESALSRGSYRLTVTITDLNTGASASRSRSFEVRGWEAGATMVAAHPDAYRARSR